MSPESPSGHRADASFTDYDKMIQQALNPDGAPEPAPAPEGQPDKFHAALNPPEANGVYELARQTADRRFTLGETVHYILPDGQSVKAEVSKVEEVLSTTTHHFDQYVTLHYHLPGQHITTVHEKRLQGHKLASMQITDAQVEAARPQHDIESILGGTE